MPTTRTELSVHSVTTHTSASERGRGNDRESSAMCRRANSAAARTGQQLHAIGRACAPRALRAAWRREVSRRPSARCMIRTRRSSTHHPHTTMASIGRQRRDRSSNTRAEPTPLVADRDEGRTRPSSRVRAQARSMNILTSAIKLPTESGPSSISRRTTDAPWITPSAIRVTCYACSASDTPTPTSTGRSVIALTLAASAVADAANCARSPVTPSSPTE